MYDIILPEIAAIQSLPAKSAYMFVFQHLREGVWPTLYTEHINTNYKDKELVNARTNFPRRLHPDNGWAWDTYMEVLSVLRRAYSELQLTVSVSKDGVIREYAYPITTKGKPWRSTRSEDINNTPRRKSSLFMPTDVKREGEDIPTHIIRDALRLGNYSISDMDTMLKDFLNDPSNTHTYTVNSTSMQKSSITTSLKRGRIAWGNVPRLLKLLGYQSVSLRLNATLGCRTHETIVGLAL